MNRLRASAERLVDGGFTRDEYTIDELDILIGDALIRQNFPGTKYSERIEALSVKFKKGEKRIESILTHRKRAILKKEVK